MKGFTCVYDESGEEVSVSEKAYDQLREIGAIEENGKLRPENELKMDHWTFMKAVLGQS